MSRLRRLGTEGLPRNIIFKNEAFEDSWRNHAVSVDEVESLTGLDFFSAQDDDI